MSNEQITNTIKKICQEKKITISTLLLNCNITKSFIYDLEKRSTSPSCDKIVRIADYLDCSVDYLLGRTDIPGINKGNADDTVKFNSTYDNKEVISPLLKEPPHYNSQNPIAILGKVAAGTPILSYEIDYGTIIPENPSASYALITQGDSMQPVILDKETIEVISQNVLEQGEIGIISINGEATCKKFYNFPDHYELRPINPEYEIIYVPKNPSTNLQIRGKVALTQEQTRRI